MFGISFPELIVIFIAIFLIVGPKRLSELSFNFGKIIGKLKTEWTRFKQTQLKDIDSSMFYKPEIELNKTIDEIKDTPAIKTDHEPK